MTPPGVSWAKMINDTPADRPMAWWPLALLLLTALLSLALSSTVLHGHTFEPDFFQVAHDGLEVFNVVICGMIFAVAWNMRSRGVADMLIAIAFLAAAVFAIAHVDHATPHDPLPQAGEVNHVLAAWFAARLAAALGLLVAAVGPWTLPAPRRHDGRSVLWLAVIVIAAITLAMQRPDWLPESLRWDGAALSSKATIEYTLAALFTLAGLLAVWRRPRTRPQRTLLAACLLAAAAELHLVLYAQRYEVSTLLGHAVGAVSYALIYRALVSERLIESTRRVAALDSEISGLQTRWREALEAGGHGVIEHDHERQLVYPSDHFRRILGLGAAELPSPCLESELDRRIHRDDLPEIQRRLQAFLKPGGRQSEAEYRMQAADGSFRWLTVRRAVIARDDEGRPQRSIGTVTDITERREIEEQARRALSQLRELAAREWGGIEDERRRIAAALHDEFGQYLAVLGMEVGELRRTTDGAANSETLQRMEKLLADARGAMRQIISDLRLPALDGGLDAAMTHLAESWSRGSGVAAEVAVVGDADRIAPSLQTMLFRVLQEALTNVARHSGASNVQITLTVDGGRAELSVADDGLGIEGEARDKPGHFGLFGIEERMAAIGGRMTLESVKGRGTELSVQVPLRPEQPLPAADSTIGPEPNP